MKVLVVDDNRVSRKMIGAELKKGGYQTLEAEDGHQALKTVLADPDIALITLDVNMPRMGGYEVCRRLRGWEIAGKLEKSHLREGMVPVIFVTGDDTFAGRQKGFEAGATEFLTKGFKPGALLNTVNRILKPERAMEGLTVVLLESDPMVRAILSGYLEEYGVSVQVAADGAAVFDMLRDESQPVHMLILDERMMMLGDRNLCTLVRGDLDMAELPIIVVSVSDDRAKALEIFKAGATDTLVKPLVKEELFARLNVFLEVQLLNHELQKRVESLQKLNDLKDEFIAACSHDLRSPLTGILGMSELLSHADNFTPLQHDMMTRIKRSGQFLLTLIHDILDVGAMDSRPPALEPAYFDVVEIGRQCVETAGYAADKKGVTLVMEAPDELQIQADRTGVIRMLHNLLTNAVKFTPQGGTVNLSLSVEDDEVVLAVADTGVGIDPAEHDQLFSRFTKKSTRGTAGEQGTGLGLAIVKGLVDQHGGRIEVTSAVGEGAIFQIGLPRGVGERG
ncbi:hybrid sensor histidine kinase/response regulator [Acanthopleuribacter pedis]|uniref:histidine kinase n=1 Tax=Acanthopleuribacter pedis TaxID=442870 RepID=A0A8J7QCZ4_9BACT|nr:hybrid sensor histidine kinase/response regulator [Acanthopleuribacter pedis]MBO1322242.1 hybrid sensor histidine kinase/response regulator [Acanthopleuribacter pedis]